VHQNGSIGQAVADASKPETCLARLEVSESLQPTGAFHLSFGKTERQQTTRSVLKKKVQPAFKKIGIAGVGWHTFRRTVGTMLAEMGEHQLTIRDYLRHSNLHVTNITNKYLQATSKTKRLAQDKLVDAILPTGILPKTNLIQ
jgi:integrase